MAITYNTTTVALAYIYRATSGGTVFSANLTGTAAFDYFNDASVVNDALYFSGDGNSFSNLVFNVGTPLVADAITVVWEFWRNPGGWTACEQLTDNTVGFTVAGINTVVFPYQLPTIHKTVSAGANRYWIRARISAVTNITEGGANQTTTPYAYDGAINIDDYTDESPCTFSAIYNYMLANYPEVQVQNPVGSRVYILDRCCVYANSRLKTLNEMIYSGVGYAWGAGRDWKFTYMQAGEKLGDSYCNGSMFLFNSYGGGGIITTSANTKMYASTLSNYYEWGMNMFIGLGDWQNCNIQGSGMRITGAGVWNRCNFFGQSYVMNAFAGTITNCKFMPYAASTVLFDLYDANISISNVDYLFYSGNHFFRLYQNIKSITLNLTNSTLLPAISDSNKPISRNIQTFAVFTSVLFYDDSAGTYTDYTTEAGNDTVADVPISGDVGDIIYFGTSSSDSRWGPEMEITCPTQSNDYVYIWEYYYGGAWITVNKTWDRTDNFTKSGILYFGKYNSAALTTINGLNYYWVRLRITTKGTGSPTLSKARWRYAAGQADWNLYEKFTFDLRVQNKSGTAISGATVTAVNDYDGSQAFSVSTDASGNIAQQSLVYKHRYFDPINYFDNYHQIAEITKGTYTVTISKSGYVTKTIKYTMDRKREEIEGLEQVKDYNFSKKGRLITQ